MDNESPRRLNSRINLTGRETQILMLTAAGYNTGEIAAELGIAVKTVGVHRSHVRVKLGARNRVQLVRSAIREGLLREFAV